MSRNRAWSALFLLLISVTLIAADDVEEEDRPKGPEPITVRVIEVGDIAQTLTAADPEKPASLSDALDQIAAIIQESVCVDTWEEVGGIGAIRPVAPGTLVISQTQTVHDQVQSLLAQLRDSRRSNVTIDMKVLCVDPGTLQGLLRDRADALVLSGAEFERLVSGVAKSIVAAPRVRLAGGSASVLKLGRTRTYVSGYSASASVTGTAEYRPVTAEIDEGVSVWVRASASPEQNRITLTMRSRVQVVRHIEQSRWAGVSGAPALNVDDPVGSKQQIESTCSISPGDAVLVGPLLVPKGASETTDNDMLREGRELYVVARASIAED